MLCHGSSSRSSDEQMSSFLRHTETSLVSCVYEPMLLNFPLKDEILSYKVDRSFFFFYCEYWTMWCRVLNSNGFKFSPTLTFFLIYFCFMQSTINHWGSPSRSIYYQYWCYWSLLRNPIVTSVFFFLVVVYYLITSKQWCAEILANEDIQPKRRKPFSAEMFLEVSNHLASKKQLSLLQWCFDRVMVCFMHTMSMSYSW